MALEWVFDSLVEFLRGPIWNIPVLTFIEQKSVVFEPGAENEQELRKIHETYKNLVDLMLGSYMADLNITPEEFDKSCSVATKKALNNFQQSLFQQVWAADDFEIFRRMMTQKNLELQLQALEFLTQKRGSVPHCMEGTRDDEGCGQVEDAILQERMSQEARREKELLEQAMQKTLVQPEAKEEEKTNDTDDTKEEKLADDAQQRSPPSSESVTAMQKTLVQPEAKQEEQTNATDDHRQEMPADDRQQRSPPSSESVTVPRGKEMEKSDEGPQTIPFVQVPDEAPKQAGVSEYIPIQEVSPAELQKRAEYLRQQRDRLLALKKQEQARRLSGSAETTAHARPRSAQAARKALREPEQPLADDIQAAFRRSLAAKLRSQVIDKVD